MRRTLRLSLWGILRSRSLAPPNDCLVCPSLISDLDNLAVEKTNLENENTYLGRFLVGFLLVSRSWA